MALVPALGRTCFVNYATIEYWSGTLREMSGNILHCGLWLQEPCLLIGKTGKWWSKRKIGESLLAD